MCVGTAFPTWGKPLPFPVLWLHCASFRARGARDGDNPRREALKCARFHDLISMPPPGALRCYDHGSSDQLAGSIAISLLGGHSNATGTAMRALVTGGAGFVGSHLAEALLRGGAEVAVTDDLPPYLMVGVITFDARQFGGDVGEGGSGRTG